MVNKPRLYLCQGCTYLSETEVVDGMVDCKAAGKVLAAIPFKSGMYYEDCPHRSGLPGKGNAKQDFLREFARRCRQSPSDDYEQIEQDLRKERLIEPVPETSSV